MALLQTRATTCRTIPAAALPARATEQRQRHEAESGAFAEQWRADPDHRAGHRQRGQGCDSAGGLHLPNVNPCTNQPPSEIVDRSVGLRQARLASSRTESVSAIGAYDSQGRSDPAGDHPPDQPYHSFASRAPIWLRRFKQKTTGIILVRLIGVKAVPVKQDA
jgi:hypothetical protein